MHKLVENNVLRVALQAQSTSVAGSRWATPPFPDSPGNSAVPFESDGMGTEEKRLLQLGGQRVILTAKDKPAKVQSVVHKSLYGNQPRLLKGWLQQTSVILSTFWKFNFF